MLPTFLVIGAQKSGTTSLYHYLRLHPQVFMAEAKELAFFSGQNWRRGTAWYEKQFERSRGAAAVGESSPQYTMYPLHRDAPARAASLIPNARLVYLVRHPVERMVSQYQHEVVAGRERRPLEQALREEELYVSASRYAFQLEQWLDWFPQERVLVVTSERLRSDRRHVLRRVYGFLGVDPDSWSTELDREWNVSATLQLRRPLVQRLMRLRPVRRLAERRPAALEPLVRTLTHRRPQQVAAEITPALEAILAERVREDVARLRRYAASDFDGWGIA